MPGIDGGGKAKAMPSGLPSSCLQIALNVLELLFFALARLPRLEATKKKPALVLCTCVRSEKSVTAMTPSIRAF